MTADTCPRCARTWQGGVDLLSTINEWKWYCTVCNIRFNDQHEVFDRFNDTHNTTESTL